MSRVAQVGSLRSPEIGEKNMPCDDAAESVVLFCGRFLQLLLWESALRTCRLGIAEAERFPEAADHYFDAIFDTTQQRLASFLTERYQLAPPTSAVLALDLLGRMVYPRLVRALLGVDEPLKEWPEETSIGSDIDLAPIRRAVAGLVPSKERPG
jgi:hypothetical protein